MFPQNEERMKKEMERYERERRKEEERLMRERIKEEEKLQREHRREVERREKFLQRENERVSSLKETIHFCSKEYGRLDLSLCPNVERRRNRSKKTRFAGREML